MVGVTPEARFVRCEKSKFESAVCVVQYRVSLLCTQVLQLAGTFSFYIHVNRAALGETYRTALAA